MGADGEARSDATQLLSCIRAGDASAAEALLPLVYEQLRAIAGSYFKGQPSNHTLQPTALVHEAFLKLVNAPDGSWRDRAHFCAVAATAMRQILKDHARGKQAAKRSGGIVRGVEVDQVMTPSGASALDLVALDAALGKLTELDPRQGRIVELWFFGGLTAEETASVLGVSSRTVERGWRRARAWLNRELESVERA